MKTINNYIKPDIEVIEIEMESETSVVTHSDVLNDDNVLEGGRFDSRRRSLWDEY